ncbi:MAG: hypothetical protein QM695_14245 [Micropruina sp.]
MNRRWSHGLVAVLACLAMIGLHAYLGERPHQQTTRVAPGQQGRLYGSTITVNSSTIGQVLYTDGVFTGRSGVTFLVVNVTIVTDGTQRGTNWTVTGAANGRTFAARKPVTLPEPGFRITQDLVFEISGDDLAGFSVVVLDRAPIYAFDPQLALDLGISPELAAEWREQRQYATVQTTRGRAEVDR